jgi:hypothetical protein
MAKGHCRWISVITPLNYSSFGWNRMVPVTNWSCPARSTVKKFQILHVDSGGLHFGVAHRCFTASGMGRSGATGAWGFARSDRFPVWPPATEASTTGCKCNHRPPIRSDHSTRQAGERRGPTVTFLPSLAVSVPTQTASPAGGQGHALHHFRSGKKINIFWTRAKTVRWRCVYLIGAIVPPESGRVVLVPSVQ